MVVKMKTTENRDTRLSNRASLSYDQRSIFTSQPNWDVLSTSTIESMQRKVVVDKLSITMIGHQPATRLQGWICGVPKGTPGTPKFDIDSYIVSMGFQFKVLPESQYYCTTELSERTMILIYGWWIRPGNLFSFIWLHISSRNEK